MDPQNPNWENYLKILSPKETIKNHFIPIPHASNNSTTPYLSPAHTIKEEGEVILLNIDKFLCKRPIKKGVENDISLYEEFTKHLLEWFDDIHKTIPKKHQKRLGHHLNCLAKISDENSDFLVNVRFCVSETIDRFVTDSIIVEADDDLFTLREDTKHARDIIINLLASGNLSDRYIKDISDLQSSKEHDAEIKFYAGELMHLWSQIIFPNVIQQLTNPSEDTTLHLLDPEWLKDPEELCHTSLNNVFSYIVQLQSRIDPNITPS